MSIKTHVPSAPKIQAQPAAPGLVTIQRACQGCGAPLERIFVDLGPAPPCEDWLPADRLLEPETFYPQDVRICDECLLVQLPTYISAEDIFREYGYFSSYSDSWVQHAARFVDLAMERQPLGPGSLVIEVASNDGYLLQHVIPKGIPVLGIEPARNIARAARDKGIPTIAEFLTAKLAREVVAAKGHGDLVVANNVWAHVPDINDFTAGLATLLAPTGLLSIEVAYLVRLIEGNEFDTIYHEHFLYYSVLSAESVLRRHGLRILDVEELPTHGGSIRLWVVHEDDPRRSSDRVAAMKAKEREAGLATSAGYQGFAAKAEAAKLDLLEFLIAEKKAGHRVVGYGAPGKGNTLLNYCGIRSDLIEYLVDANPYKHGRFAPGSHIPVYPPDRIAADRPDVIVILPWNLRTEIAEKLAYTSSWGARLVVPIPHLEVL